MTAWTVRALVLGFLLAIPVALSAQSPAPSSNPQTAGSEQGLLQPAELEALVAPIALYPDILLPTVRMASTYPLEVRPLGDRQQEPQGRSIEGRGGQAA